MSKTLATSTILSKYEEKYIWFFSLIVGLLWWCTQGISYNPDSTTYLLLSQYIAGNSDNFSNLILTRTFGYPLLMLISGTPYLNSFKILLLLQLGMAIYIPILFYRSLNLIINNSKFALACTMTLIFSLLPYIYCKTIMPDHFFIFMIFFTSYRIIRYYQSETKKDLVYLVGSLIILTLIRPSANLFFLLVFLHSAIFIKKHLVTWLVSLVVFLSILFGISTTVLFKGAIPHIQGTFVQKINETLFYHLYLKGLYNNNDISDPGRYTKQVKALVEQYAVNTASAQTHLMPEYFFRTLHTDTNKFISLVFNEPNLQYFGYIKSALQASLASDQYQLPNNMSRSYEGFMRSVSFEILKQHPSYLISYFKTYFLGAGASFAGQMLFYHSYVPLPLLSENSEDKSNFYPLSGASNIKLHNSLKKYVYAYPTAWDTMAPAEVFSIYKGNPDALLQQSIIEKPSFITLWFMWNAMDTMFSAPETPNVFMQAAMENMSKNKETTFLMYVNNVLYFLFGSSSYYYHGLQKISLLSLKMPEGEDTLFSSSPRYIKMNQEIEAEPIINISDKRSSLLFDLGSLQLSLIKIVTAMIIFCGFILTFKTKHYRTTTILLIIWLSHIVISSVFGEPYFRYIIQIMPLNFLLGSIVLFDITMLYSKEQSVTNSSSHNHFSAETR
jgi:hypothetical protein